MQSFMDIFCSFVADAVGAEGSSIACAHILAWAIAILLLGIIIGGIIVYLSRRGGKKQNADDEPSTADSAKELQTQIREIAEQIAKLGETLSAKLRASESGAFAKLDEMWTKKASADAEDKKKFARQMQDNAAECLGNAKNDISRVLSDIGELQEQTRETFGNYAKLRDNLDAKDAEISRLKNGYDAEIFRRFLRRFIRIDGTVGEYAGAPPQTSEEMTDGLRLIQGMFEDALDECGVEKFSPEIGEDYRTAFGVADRPKIEPTTDASKHFAIAEVLADGYVLKSPDGDRNAIVKAKVKIFKHQEGD